MSFAAKAKRAFAALRPLKITAAGADTNIGIAFDKNTMAWKELMKEYTLTPDRTGPRDLNGEFTNTRSYEVFLQSIKFYCAARNTYATLVDGDTEPLIDLEVFKQIGDGSKLDLGVLMELSEEGRGADVEKVLATTIGLLPDKRLWAEYVTSSVTSNASTVIMLSQMQQAQQYGSAVAISGAPGGPSGVSGWSNQHQQALGASMANAAQQVAASVFNSAFSNAIPPTVVVFPDTFMSKVKKFFSTPPTYP